MRVLIVDDMAEVREALRILLGDVPEVEVVGETNDHQQVLPMLDTLKPEMVLLDIEMSGGLHLARQIKNHATSPLLVALSVYTDDDLRRQAEAAGADLYLDKSALLPNVMMVLREKAAQRGKPKGSK